MWSIYKIEQLDPEHELVLKYPQAVSHDGINTVFVEAPSDLTDCFVYEGSDYVEGSDLLIQMILTVGSFLVSQTDTPLVAPKVILETLFKTPHHRIWCKSHESLEAFQSDYEAVFGSPLDVTGKTFEEAQEESKQMIKSMVTSQ